MTEFIGRTFPSGSIVLADQDVPPTDWQPIDQVIAMMHRRWQLAETEPFVYYEVYLRR